MSSQAFDIDVSLPSFNDRGREDLTIDRELDFRHLTNGVVADPLVAPVFAGSLTCGNSCGVLSVGCGSGGGCGGVTCGCTDGCTNGCDFTNGCDYSNNC
jgi:hypothetical protein